MAMTIRMKDIQNWKFSINYSSYEIQIINPNGYNHINIFYIFVFKPIKLKSIIEIKYRFTC